MEFALKSTMSKTENELDLSIVGSFATMYISPQHVNQLVIISNSRALPKIASLVGRYSFNNETTSIALDIGVSKLHYYDNVKRENKIHVTQNNLQILRFLSKSLRLDYKFKDCADPSIYEDFKKLSTHLNHPNAKILLILSNIPSIYSDTMRKL